MACCLRVLSLRQFRGHHELDWQPQPGWNLILGANGEGKTSLLESIYYLSRFKSFRTGLLRELVEWDFEGFRLEATYGKATTPQSSERLTVKAAANRKTYYLDGQPVEKLDQIWGRLSCVVLSTEDGILIRGPAQKRLAWMDSLIAQAQPEYLFIVQRYNAVLRQRNAWLRHRKGVASEQKVNEALETQLSLIGQQMSEARSLLMNSLNKIVPNVAARLWADQEKKNFTLDYLPNWMPGYKPSWEASRAKEIIQGRTLQGPHRDELVLQLSGKSVSRYASEGETRLAALLLRWIEAERIRTQRGAWPIFLLDDSLNPLDPTRREAWIGQIPPECQVFLATTERPSNIARRDLDTVWKLESGALKQL